MTAQPEQGKDTAKVEAILAKTPVFKMMADNSLDAILLIDLTPQTLYANRAAHELFDYDYATQELVGQSGFVFWDEADLPFFKQTVLPQVISGGWNGEVRQKCKDGTTFEAWAVGYPICDNQGQLVGVAVTLRDITERKQAEQALRGITELQKAIVDNAGYAIISATPEGIIHTFNRTAQRMLGYTEQEVIGKLTPAVFHDPIEVAERAAVFSKELGLSLEPGFEVFVARARQNLPNEYEWTYIRKDGSRFPVLLSITSLCDGEGKITGFLGIASDVTERRRTEQERMAHLRFFECIDQVNRAIHGANDLEQMMSDVLDVVLSIFGSDRAFLCYPCDPEAPLWSVPMERNRPEYPGAGANGVEMPLSEGVANIFRLQLASNGPLKFGSGPGFDYPLPPELTEHFGIQSHLVMGIYPKVSKPWQFGTHQCSYRRIWTPEEERLFQEIGRRIADALTSLLMYRDLLESERRQQLALQAGQIGVFEADLASGRGTWTPKLAEIWGIPDDFTGNFVTFCWEHLHPEDLPLFKESLTQWGRSRQEGELELRIIRPDGAMRWIHLRVQVIQETTTGSSRVVGVNIDITGRKQAEVEQEQLQQEIIEAQRRSLQELSTPIIPVMEQIIVMPLIGSIDSTRARDITRTLLAGIRENRTKVVILDITGVPLVDSGVASHLNKTIQAARLKGARTVITGVSDAVAETIVDLGIDWRNVETLADLQTGLVVALASLGIKLTRL